VQTGDNKGSSSGDMLTANDLETIEESPQPQEQAAKEEGKEQKNRVFSVW
jgi:hypothetical protein